MTDRMHAGVEETCDTYQRLRYRGASIDDAVTAIEPWLRSEGGCGLVELLWCFAENTSGSRSDFSEDRYGREIHEAVVVDAVVPGLAQSFDAELADWVATLSALEGLVDEIARRRCAHRPSAARPGRSRGSAHRESSGPIRKAGHGVAVKLGLKDDRLA